MIRNALLMAIMVSMMAFAEEVKAPDHPKDISTLVSDLSSESYTTREAAMLTLWKLGDAALPDLRKAMASRDPELVDRASELVLYISAGVLHDSPDEVKEMVLTFSSSDVNQKLTMLRKLSDMGHWRQVLHLARMEKNIEVRRRMSDLVAENASKAARSAIAQGDFEFVEEVIHLLDESDSALIMRAWFFKHRGMLDDELKKAASIPGKKGARWRLALHRVNGNVPAALKEARILGDQVLMRLLELLQGKPKKWLEHDPPGAPVLAPIPDVARRIQLARLNGNSKRAAAFVQEMIGMAKTDATRRSVMLALAGNGFRQEALSILAKDDPIGAMAYYDTIESHELALKALGIPQNAIAPYTQWVKETTDYALEEEDKDACMRILSLGGFLAHRGEKEHVMPVIKPLMDGLLESGSDAWFDFLGEMANLHMGEQALQLIVECGNEDQEADRAVKTLLAPLEQDGMVHLWEALKKRNNQQIDKALHELAILTGLIQDTKDEAKAIHQALLAGANAGNVEKTGRLRALLVAAESRNDLQTSYALLEELARLNNDLDESLIKLDAEMFRWEKLEPHYAAAVEDDPSDYDALTNLYITRHMLGKNQEADQILGKIMLLSMGELRALWTIAYRFHYAGMKKEATEFWLRILVTADPGNNYMNATINMLASYPDYLFESNQWQLAAAIMEARIAATYRARSTNESIRTQLGKQFFAEFSRGMHALRQNKGQRSVGIARLDRARKLIPGDGTLADHFFPHLLKSNLGKTYDKWFEESYRHMAKSCAAYPHSHNAHNTAAWLASRAVRRLDDAHQHATKALSLRPHQGAYIDTMAEVWFARGNRSKAVDWSEKAVQKCLTRLQGVFRTHSMNVRNYQSLYHQLRRFKSEALPGK